MTVDEFLQLRPEFRNAGPQIAPYLADAQRRVDPNVFGDKTDIAVSLKCAHMLCVSPFGRTLKLATVNDDGTTYYSQEFDRLIRENVIPILVV